MAKLLIPQGGNQPPLVRNFDEYLVLDHNGRVLYKKKAAGTWVLTNEGGVRQLAHYKGSGGRRDTYVFIPMFWLLLGMWITLMFQRFGN